MFKRMIQSAWSKRGSAVPVRQADRRRGGRLAGEAVRRVATVDRLEERWLFSTIDVTTFSDVVNSADGVTSVREAIALAAANAGDDQVVLPAGTYPLNNELVITDTSGKVSIRSYGGTATLNAQHRSRILSIYGGSDVTLERLRITGGRGSQGAGIHNAGSHLLLIVDCLVDGNGSSDYGGGIYNYNSTVEVTNTTIAGNSAQRYGGGIFSYFRSTAQVSNSTLSGNTAQYGGGIFNDYDSTVGLTNSTISSNAAYYYGGGIYNAYAASLWHTIIAGNSAGSFACTDAAGSLDSRGYNLIGIIDGSSGWQETDLRGTAAQPLDPKLAPLANNGGPTQTMALLPGSPAINAGNNALAFDSGLNFLTTDQRGAGYARIVSGTVDMAPLRWRTSRRPPTPAGLTAWTREAS